MNKTIKKFLKPTKPTITATFFVIIILMIIQNLAIRSWPKETIFSKIYTIVFMPIELIKQIILSLLGTDFYSSFAGPITFALNIITYYLLGCIIVYAISLYKKRAIKNNSLKNFYTNP